MSGYFYNFCPSATETLCGPMELEPTNEKVTVSRNNLRFSVIQGRYEACYYVIKKKNDITYGNGNILVSISKMDNIAISLHKSDGALSQNAENIVDSNSVASRGFTYKLENKDALVVSVHVLKPDTDTNFSFEYWTDAGEADLIQ